MANFKGKFGLASAANGFSDGLRTGANTVANLARVRNDRVQMDRNDARSRRREEIVERFDTARIAQMEEETAGMNQARKQNAALSEKQAHDVKMQADANSQFHDWFQARTPAEKQDYVGGLMKAGEINMGMGSGMRAVGIALSTGSMEPLAEVPPEAVESTKKILSDIFNIDMSQIEEIRKAEDGGIEVLSGGKVVGKIDNGKRINVMRAMFDNGNMYYSRGVKSIREAQQIVGSSGNGSQGGRHGSGLAGAGEDPGKVQNVYTGEGKQVTAVVKNGKFTRLQEKQRAPKNVWEVAERLVDTGITTTARKVTGLNNDRWGAKEGFALNELVEKARDAKAGSKAKYNAAIKEWVHGYIEDAVREAAATAQKESSDGRYTRARLDELVVEKINMDGLGDIILPYMASNPELK